MLAAASTESSECVSKVFQLAQAQTSALRFGEAGTGRIGTGSNMAPVLCTQPYSQCIFASILVKIKVPPQTVV